MYGVLLTAASPEPEGKFIQLKEEHMPFLFHVKASKSLNFIKMIPNIILLENAVFMLLRFICYKFTTSQMCSRPMP